MSRASTKLLGTTIGLLFAASLGFQAWQLSRFVSAGARSYEKVKGVAR